MVETSPITTTAIFPEQLLDVSPAWAKSGLADFWKQQARFTRYHAEERGISGQALGLITLDMWSMMKEEAESFPEAFGTENYTTVYLDGLVREQYMTLVEDSEENLKPSVIRLVERFFDKEKRHIIYELCGVENLKAICHANGGIPVVTEQEIYFYETICN